MEKYINMDVKFERMKFSFFGIICVWLQFWLYFAHFLLENRERENGLVNSVAPNSVKNSAFIEEVQPPF